MKILFFISIILITTFTAIFPQSSKMEKWKKPSFFRGYNILKDNPKSLKDFVDLKNAGANFAYIGCSGFYYTDSPYSRWDTSIIATDSLVSWARQSGLYYAITLRGGPGRRDVYLESIKYPKSTIWVNPDEQLLYAGMLREITERYLYDSMFVGIAPFMEPNPLFDQLYISPDMLDSMLQSNNIDFNEINQSMLDSIRSISIDIPVILQSVAYSCPEFINLLEINKDTNVVYEFHSYRPTEYVKDTSANTKKYPDKYISFYNLAYKYHDKKYISDSVFHRVRELQKASKAPILLGEFGMLRPQINGPQFVKDISDICLESGWHFAYWDWRDHEDAWNFENFGADYWETVVSSFLADPISIKTEVEISFDNGIILVKTQKIPKEICFYDILGKKENFQNSKINLKGYGNFNYFDMPALQEGVYFVEVKFEDSVKFIEIYYYENSGSILYLGKQK